MNYHHHIIRNFPHDYPRWKKLWANMLFFFGGTVIHPRKNWLSHWDCVRATHRLRRGDVVLVGGLRRMSHLLIGDVVTHTLLFIGRRTFVHSIADGVETISLHAVFSEYDTMILARPRKAARQQVKKAIAYALAQIGKPYDFDFAPDKQKFYCSELVTAAYKHAGFDIGITPVHFEGRRHAMLPIQFLQGNFAPVYLSHNLAEDDGKIILR